MKFFINQGFDFGRSTPVFTRIKNESGVWTKHPHSLIKTEKLKHWVIALRLYLSVSKKTKGEKKCF